MEKLIRLISVIHMVNNMFNFGKKSILSHNCVKKMTQKVPFQKERLVNESDRRICTYTDKKYSVEILGSSIVNIVTKALDTG